MAIKVFPISPNSPGRRILIAELGTSVVMRLLYQTMSAIRNGPGDFRGVVNGCPLILCTRFALSILYTSSLDISVTPYSYPEPRNLLCAIFRLLEWVSQLIILPDPKLLLLLGHHMLPPNLLCLFLHEFSDISRIPQLAGHTEIFTASH